MLAGLGHGQRGRVGRVGGGAVEVMKQIIGNSLLPKPARQG